MTENRKPASGRGKSTQRGQKGGSAAASGRKKARGRKGAAQNPYMDEAVLMAALVVSILFLLSVFHLCGEVFGPFVSDLLFGVFGILAYLFPFALFFGTAFYLSNKKSRPAKRKLFSSVGMFLLLTGIFELVGGGYNKAANFLSYYTRSAAGKSGGGLTGGILVKILCSVFGTIGAYVILLGGILILFMLITEKLIFAGLKKQSRKTVEQVKKRRIAYEEERETREQDDAPPKRRAKFFTFLRDGEPEENTEPEAAGDIPADCSLPEAGPETAEETLPVYEEELLHKFKDSKKEPSVRAVPPDPFLQSPFSINRGFTAEEPEKETEPAEEAVWKEEPAFIPMADTSADMTREDMDKPAVPVIQEEESGKEGKEPEHYNKNDRIASDKIVSEKAKLADEVKSTARQAAAGGPYRFPPLRLLVPPRKNQKGASDTELKATALKLQQTLKSFGVQVTVTNVSCGPTVTRYELQPEQGVKVSRITGLADDIKLNLAAADIRIEAPIPGKAAVGIEVPNKENATVMLRELLESQEFKKHTSRIAFAVGKDIGGQTVVTDIGKMPHLLIAGATGSGKSVCINTLIMSILYKASPDEVKLIMIDPKVVELSVYNGIPHLLIPVVTEPKKASAALNWAVAEMNVRYKRFADFGVRDLKGYNEKAAGLSGEEAQANPFLPQIIIIVDELADLMMVAPGEVEESICRLAQLARAAGLHLIIATQRPSVNVITGVIKANVPSRIAFSVSSAVDSRTIIDGAGAEKLLGKGDMLFFPSGIPKPVRVQGAFVSDKEVSDVVEFLKEQNSHSFSYDNHVDEKISEAAASETPAGEGPDRDEYFEEAGRFIIEKDKASIGMLQRVYKIGFNRAARIMDQLCEAGVVGPEEGTKPRRVIMTLEEFEQSIGKDGAAS